MALAVFVMYVILAILYQSYVHPLTVLSTLPTALVGGLLTLFLFHELASLYAFVGMFMLMGIVKKNGIMIVDFARQRVDAGESAETAIHAGESGSIQTYHYDDSRCSSGSASYRCRCRGGCSFPATARACGSWRVGGIPVYYVVHHSCDLLVF